MRNSNRKEVYFKEDYNLMLTTIRVEAKRANQRLRELEKQGLTSASKAYSRTVTDALNLEKNPKDALGRELFIPYSRTKKGDIKFRTNVKNLTFQEAQSYMATLNSFLNAKTSTKKGTQEHYQSIASALNDKFEGGKDLTPSEWGQVWRAFNAGDMAIDSDTIISIAKRLKAKDIKQEDVVEYIKSFDSSMTRGKIENTISKIKRNMTPEQKKEILTTGKWRSSEEIKRKSGRERVKEQRQKRKQVKRGK